MVFLKGNWVTGCKIFPLNKGSETPVWSAFQGTENRIELALKGFFPFWENSICVKGNTIQVDFTTGSVPYSHNTGFLETIKITKTCAFSQKEKTDF